MIKHVLSDGRTLDSLEGFRLPYTQATETAYRLLAGFLEGGGRVGRDIRNAGYTPHTEAQETVSAV